MGSVGERKEERRRENWESGSDVGVCVAEEEVEGVCGCCVGLVWVFGFWEW